MVPTSGTNGKADDAEASSPSPAPGADRLDRNDDVARRRIRTSLRGALSPWLGPGIAGVVAVAGSYAAIAASLPGSATRSQLIWTGISSLVAGLFAFLTARAGGFAIRTKQDSSRTDDDVPNDLFISYVRADRAWSAWIQWVLACAGYRIRLQGWSFLPNQDYAARRNEALRVARAILVLISPNYLSSPYAAGTWTKVITEGKQPVLAARVEACEPPEGLGAHLQADLAGLPEEAAEERLLAGLLACNIQPRHPPMRRERADGRRISYPAYGPTESNLPARNPSFTGRNALLEAIRGELEADRRSTPSGLARADQSDIVRGCALVGPGGIGKTQTAVEYAYRYATAYDLTWWISAEQQVSVAGSLAGLARRLGIEESAEQDEMLGKLMRELGRRDRWLLIFDNAEQPSDLEPYWPRAGDGHVLITSRNPTWGGRAATLMVQPLSEDEGVVFLRRRTGCDERSAAEVVEEVGGLPLALEQAGAYVDSANITMDAYLALLRDRLDDCLELGEAHVYGQTVATTWTISLQRVGAELGAAVDLLRLCSFLAPDDIPRSTIADHAAVLPSELRSAVSDPIHYNLLVALTGRYSLIAATPEALTMHRLIQAVVRKELDAKGVRLWTAAAVRLVHRAIPDDPENPSQWPMYERFLPHGVVVAEWSERVGVEPLSAARLLASIGRYLCSRCEYEHAMKLLERSLTLLERAPGREDLDLVETLGTIGLVAYRLADLPRALQATERAVAICRASSSASRTAADSLGLLAKVLVEFAELERARTTAEEALVIAETAYGPDHPAVAAILDTLGIALWRLGDLDEAAPTHRRALIIRRQTLGDRHPDIAASLIHLATVHRDVGEFQEARELLEQGVAMLRDVYGPENTEVGDAEGVLATVIARLDEPQAARQLLEGAVRKCEAALGVDHPDVAGKLMELGEVLLQLQDLHSARASLERAQTIFERIYGDDHPYALTNHAILEAVLARLHEVDTSGETSAHERD